MERIDLCIPQALDSYKLSQEFLYQKIIFSWAEIAGKVISNHCFIKEIKESVIIICVYNSSWLQQLNMQKKAILKKINEFYGADEFTEIRFIIGSKKLKQKLSSLDGYTEEYLDLKTVLLQAEEIEHIDKSVKKIKNSSLRHMIRKIRIRQKQKEYLLYRDGYHHCPECNCLITKDESICSQCKDAHKKEKIITIKKLLKLYPTVDYEDFKQYMACFFDEYCQAKKELLYLYLDRIYHGSQCLDDLYMAAMLITRKNKDELTLPFVINLTNKYRKKSF